MKLQTGNYRFGGDLSSLITMLSQLLPRVASQVNAVSEGRISGHYNAATTAPTTQLWQHGDYLRNSAPVLLGPAGSQYVIKGWLCIAGGEPGTWVEDRGVTGT